jgi:hypothetical protein
LPLVVRFDLVRSRQPHLSCRVGASSGFIVGSERRGGRVSSVNFPPAALVNCDAQLFGGLDRRVWVELGAGRPTGFNGDLPAWLLKAEMIEAE